MYPIPLFIASPSGNGVAQLKIHLCAEAAHLKFYEPHTHAQCVRASGAENIAYFQCCRKQSWFGEGIKTKARTSLQHCTLLLLFLMGCWYFHYELIFPGFITQS